MANLTTCFFGLELKSPVVVGSSGLSSSIEKIKLIEQYGAGAVVLKSVFEEEIYHEFQQEYSKQIKALDNQEYLDYLDYEIKGDKVKEYLNLISGAKKEGVKMPIVASINCISGSDWKYFADRLANAGADALELNIFMLPSDLHKDAAQIKKNYLDIVNKVTSQVDIPVTIKISPYFSDMAMMIKDLSETKLSGITLFNRSFNIDIDIDEKQLSAAKILSHPFDYLNSLRWVGIMSPRINCDLAASTGIMDYKTAIKMIMAGARAVQIVSGIYKNGFEFIGKMNTQISAWMDSEGYSSLDEITGIVNSGKIKDPALYERVQFMKHFGGFSGEEE